MEMTINNATLRRAVETCRGIVDKRSTLPILSNLLLTVSGKTLQVASCNLREEVVTNVPVSAATDGSVCVDAQGLFSRIGAMPEGDIVLAMKDESLNISAKGVARKFKLATILGSEYPKLAAPGGEPTELSSGMLGRLVAAVKFAVGTDESRPYTQSALLEAHGSSITMAATNGRCLSTIAIASESPEMSVCIPFRALGVLHSMCSDDDDRIIIRLEGSRIFFTSGSTTLAALIPDYAFPPYRNALPDETGPAFSVDRQALIDSMKAVAVSAGEFGQVKISSDKNAIALSCGDDGQDVVPADLDTGCKFSVSVAASYMTGALQAIDAPSVRIRCGDGLGPIMIRPTETEDADRLCVVMPIRN